MSIVKIRGKNVNVQELNQGGGPPLIMIHGMFGNLSQFYLTIAPLLSKHYHIVMYDIKSHGKSERSSIGYDLVSLSDDIIDLMNILKIEKAHLLGYSYGALMALKFAIRFPERTNKLTLIEPPPRPNEPMKNEKNYDWNDFEAFALSLPEHVIKSFFRSKRQVTKVFEMYQYILNDTSFVHDMNVEMEIDENELKRIKNDILLLYGKSSICLPMGVKLFFTLNNPKAILKEGDHGFFINHQREIVNDIFNFLDSKPIKGVLKNTDDIITDYEFLKM